MSYFNRFPLLAYAANNNAVVNIVSDVLRRVTVDKKTKENLVIFDEYDIQDGETPELVSYKFYDTTDYHWVILIVNDILDPRFGWPLTDEQLYTYTANKYGAANVNATKHYVAFEGSDIVVDPTQTVVTTTLEVSYVDLFRMAANGFIGTTENQQAFIDYLYSAGAPQFTYPIPRADITHSTTLPLITGGDALGAQRYEINVPSGDFTRTISHINNHIIKPIVLNYPNLVPAVLESSTSLPSARNTSNLYVTDGNVFYWLKYPETSRSILEISVSNISGGSAELVEYKNFLASNVLTHYPKGDVTGDTGFITERDVSNVAVYLSTGNTSTSTLMNVKAIIDSVYNIPGFLPTLETVELAYPNAYEVTNIAYESQINESKRRIRVLKNQYISAFVNEFERLVNG